MLEKLEEDHLSLLHERLKLVSSRRQVDDEDDLNAFYGPLPTPAPETDEPEQTDELGRTIPKPNPTILRKERRAARSIRHAQRVQKRALMKSRPDEEEEEGYSTDSSLPPLEASDYSAAVSSLSTRKKDVLSDVRADEFRNPTGEKWSAWRERYGDTYRSAWGGLGVVSAWEFWVRLEIVGWDCIEVWSSAFARFIPCLKFSFSRTFEVWTVSGGTKASTSILGRPQRTRRKMKNGNWVLTVTSSRRWCPLRSSPAYAR